MTSQKVQELLCLQTDTHKQTLLKTTPPPHAVRTKILQ